MKLHFVHSIKGLQNFLAIPIMNPLAGFMIYISRLMVVSRKAKEEVPCDGLLTNASEYFTRTNLVKIKNAITYEPLTLVLHYSS